jgi:Zn finger protein HypA/HybF involved in hydrogenase expression
MRPQGEIKCPNCDLYYDSKDLKPQMGYGLLCPRCDYPDPGRQ